MSHTPWCAAAAIAADVSAAVAAAAFRSCGTCPGGTALLAPVWTRVSTKSSIWRRSSLQLRASSTSTQTRSVQALQRARHAWIHTYMYMKTAVLQQALCRVSKHTGYAQVRSQQSWHDTHVTLKGALKPCISATYRSGLQPA